MALTHNTLARCILVMCVYVVRSLGKIGILIFHTVVVQLILYWPMCMYYVSPAYVHMLCMLVCSNLTSSAVLKKVGNACFTKKLGEYMLSEQGN